MHTSFVALALAFLTVVASVLGAPNLANSGGSLQGRQSTPDSNATMYPDACMAECASIDRVLANCGMNMACRCTEENAGHMSNCMNCFIANLDTSRNPSLVHAAQKTLERFHSQCASAGDPIRMTFSVTATGSEMPMITSAPQDESDRSSSASRRILQGAIAGGVLGGVSLVAMSIWLFFRHRKATRQGSNMSFIGKERPFRRLEEPDIAESVARPKPAVVKA